MKHPLKWEFPGGKLEDNEEPEDCLKREIWEELKVKIEILEKMPSNTHSYTEGKPIELIPYRCKLLTIDMELNEHKKVKWLNPAEAKVLDWAEADIPILRDYCHIYYKK